MYATDLWKIKCINFQNYYFLYFSFYFYPHKKYQKYIAYFPCVQRLCSFYFFFYFSCLRLYLKSVISCLLLFLIVSSWIHSHCSNMFLDVVTPICLETFSKQLLKPTLSSNAPSLTANLISKGLVCIDFVAKDHTTWYGSFSVVFYTLHPARNSRLPD